MEGLYQKLFLGLVLGLLIVLYVFWVEPEIVGFAYDDGLYLLGARSLAEQHAYLLNAETAIVKYPPLFSGWVALFWQGFPSFPENVTYLKLVNVLLAGAFLWISQLWLKKRGCSWQFQLAVMLLVGLNPFFMQVATEIRSEPLYMLLTFLTLMYADKVGPAGRAIRAREILLLSLLSAMVFYTRTIGLGLIGGIFFWLWARRQIRATWIYLISTLLCCLPWFLWVHHADAVPLQTPHSYVISYNMSYFAEWMVQFASAPSKWQFILNSLMNTLMALADVTMPLLALTVSKASWLSLCLGGVVFYLFGRQLYREWKSHRVSASSLSLLFMIMIVVLWGGQELATSCRLLMVMLPCLYWMLWQACHDEAKRIQLPASNFMVGLLAVILLGNIVLIENWFSSKRETGAIRQNSVMWRDYQAAFVAVNRLTQPQDRLLSEYPLLYSLYTHLKYDQGDFYRRNGSKISDEAFDRLYAEDLLAAGIQYVVLEPALNHGRMVKPMMMIGPFLPVMQKRIRQNPDQYRLIYQSPHAVVRLYRVTDPSEWTH